MSRQAPGPRATLRDDARDLTPAGTVLGAWVGRKLYRPWSKRRLERGLLMALALALGLLAFALFGAETTHSLSSSGALISRLP